MERFTVTQEHIKLLKELCVRWCEDEFGAPCIDAKRPFGNSDVFGDMAEILNITIPEDNLEGYNKCIDYLYVLYKGLQNCLQILCTNLCIEVGEYECDDYKRDWRKVK